MKTKTAAIVGLVVVVGAWVYIHAQAAPGAALPAGPNGRYQVIAADIDSEGMGGNLKHKTAIRIDTQTGHAWELTELPGKQGGSNFYWLSLSEGDTPPAH